MHNFRSYFKDYMDRNFGDSIKTNDGSYRIRCINAECEDNTKKDKQKMYVTPDKNLFHCFRCGSAGNGAKFIALFEGKSIPEVLDEFNSTDPLRKPAVPLLGDFNKKVLDYVFGKDEVNDSVLEIPMYIFPAEQSPEALYFLKSRGFTVEDIRHYSITYCFDGRFRERVIIPCFEDGKLVYFVARSVRNNFSQKVLNPTDGPFGKSDVVFNLDNVNDFIDSVVITEGVFDAMTVGTFGTVAIFGKKISSNQLNKIINNLTVTEDKNIYVMLDGDARREAFDLGKKLYNSELFQNVFIVDMKYGEDPNSIGHDECIKRLQEVEPFNLVKDIGMFF